MSEPSYLLSLAVENIRCFGPRQELLTQNEDGSPAMWTVLLGENGVGKTTLLQLIAGTELDETDGNKKTGFSARLASASLVGWASDQIRNKTSAHVAVRYSHRSDDITIRFPLGTQSGCFEAVGKQIHGYGATRRSRKTALTKRVHDDWTHTLFDDDAILIDAEEWYLRQHIAAREPGPHQMESQKRLKQVRDLLTSNILPDVTDLRIAGLGGVRAQPYVEVETVYGWVPMRELSLGYKALIAWVVDLSARMIESYPDSEDPLGEPAIVLVDEIDLHLHPTWQRQLVGYLRERFPKVQFIVTAHSPLVVQAAGDANVVLLRREGDHVVIDNDFDHVSTWRADQILTSDLFGLPSAGPPKYDDIAKERDALLGKPTLTDRERTRIKEIDAILDETPSGRTPEESEAMRLIMQAAAQLRARGES